MHLGFLPVEVALCPGIVDETLRRRLEFGRAEEAAPAVTADEAAGSASRASSSASSASSSAASAQNTLNNVNTRGAEIINGMNAKQAWFDQNYGKMITNHNIYVAEDQVARAGVAQNAERISDLNSSLTNMYNEIYVEDDSGKGDYYFNFYFSRNLLFNFYGILKYLKFTI